MPGLEIHPHSRRASGFAVALLGLLAAGSFVAGMNRVVIAAHGPSPFPPPVLASQARADAVPDAKPAPDMQVAEAPVRPRHAAKTPTPDDASAAPDAPAAADAPAAPAVDASATAPEPAAPPPPTPPTDSEPPYA